MSFLRAESISHSPSHSYPISLLTCSNKTEHWVDICWVWFLWILKFNSVIHPWTILDDLLSSYNTVAHFVLQYFGGFICINSLVLVSPDILSCWKASWACFFYSCICHYRKWGENLICPGGWQAFWRIVVYTKKAVGFGSEDTTQEMLWSEVSADSSLSVTGPGIASSVTTIRGLSCRTQSKNTATFSLLTNLSTNAVQKVFGRICKSKNRRVIWTWISFSNTQPPTKAFTEPEEV